MSSASLIWGIIFGAIGFAYFLYGKKQRLVVPFLCGIGLMAFPYFIGNSFALAGIGALLMAVPYFIRA